MSVSAQFGHSPRMHDDGANLLLPVRDVIRAVTDRLRAAGISNLVLMDALGGKPALQMRAVRSGELWQMQSRIQGEWKTIRLKNCSWTSERGAKQWAVKVYGPREGYVIDMQPTRKD